MRAAIHALIDLAVLVMILGYALLLLWAAGATS